ncbi:sedlin, N-terminal conserved domain containing protein [Theileria equi strain WA]|uniref:Sedlin, N-terminal conserved domain containing protein n=1 Tax=Theileria equi strain WA TaxID=1537102 RepID=L0AU53_THEEQ|nr:sedlin, N-terminal conserved domain containing protein [Theileria equi strain WA]AFZ79177.1 sedlin, N-terminal conserved domain containing protein [Theileria equi strain WA]|eukprot:XP_004828843.1 sedlin, N-terminal conserved domain containing protein [Theileria equi strain WA]
MDATEQSSSDVSNEIQSKILVLVIVGRDDKPLYLEDLSTPGWRPDPPHLASFVAHQSLDAIDDIVWNNPNMFLKQIDIFDFLAVSAYVTSGHTTFLLITRTNNASSSDFTVYSSNASAGAEPQPPSSESIRSFFKELHELYCKQLMNPLYAPNGTIDSLNFKLRVQQAAKKYLI